MTTTENSISQRLFEQLVKMSARSMDWQQRINAHIHARTGHVHLMAFHNACANEEERIQIYKECLEAIVAMHKGLVPKLEGQVEQSEPLPTNEPPQLGGQSEALGAQTNEQLSAQLNLPPEPEGVKPGTGAGLRN